MKKTIRKAGTTSFQVPEEEIYLTSTEKESVNAEYKKAYEEGDIFAPLKLVDGNPEYMKKKWVQEAWAKHKYSVESFGCSMDMEMYPFILTKDLPKELPDDLKKIPISGFSSRHWTFDDLIKKNQTAFEEFKGKYQKRDMNAVIDLLNFNGYFIRHPLVQKAATEFILGRKFPPEKRGRKKGDTRVNVEILVAVVDALVEKGMSKLKAFEELECALGEILTWSRLKTLYHNAKAEREN